MPIYDVADPSARLLPEALEAVRRAGRPLWFHGVPLTPHGEIRHERGWVELTLRADAVCAGVAVSRIELVRWNPKGQVRAWERLDDSYADAILAYLKTKRARAR